MTTRVCFLAVSLLLCSGYSLQSQNTIGTIHNESAAFNGYTLFSPIPSTTTYLIDNDGRLIRSWVSAHQPGQSVYLLEDGSVLRAAQIDNTVFGAGGGGGKLEKFAWDGTKTWEYIYSSDLVCTHHDATPLPNGNVLAIAWEYKSLDSCLAAGRDPRRLPAKSLWPDHIIELQPEGANGARIVWEWHAWDHLVQSVDATKANYGVPAEHPERIDINAPFQSPADWMHSNGIAYNAELDQIVLCVHNFNEFWVIDHSTTTEEARGSTGGRRGRGGDLLYRWGNPRMYGAGVQADQQLFGMHDAQWIAPGRPGAGNILVFNNGLNKPGAASSSVDEIVPPLHADGLYDLVPASAYGPAAPLWRYEADPPASMFSKAISGAQRLPNGNTIICVGQNGRFVEVTQDKRVVWEYLNPVTNTGIMRQGDSLRQGPSGSGNLVFKTRKYAPDFAGFAGRDLTPGAVIELAATAVERPGATPVLALDVYPQPASELLTARLSLPSPAPVDIALVDALGRVVARQSSPSGVSDPIIRFPVAHLPAGVYHLQATAASLRVARAVVLRGK